MQPIGDKMFYLAEAYGSHVRPRFAQAETAERLRAKLSTPVKKSQRHSRPSRGVGCAAGRQGQLRRRPRPGRELLSVFPRAAELGAGKPRVPASRGHPRGRVGVRRFLDIRCGLPTSRRP